MTYWRTTEVACIAIIEASISCGARAGGFDRYDQDVSLLFDSAATVVDVLGSYVTTDSHYDSVDELAEKVPLISDFWAGSLRVKFTPARDLACLAHTGQPFGSDIDHGMNWSRADVVTEQKFRVSEAGLSCAYRIPVDHGAVRTIAGATVDHVDFKQYATAGASPALASRLQLDGTTMSWRAGLAYELPDAGIVASLMYYAPISFGLSGDVVAPSVAPAGEPLSVFGDVDFPQSVEASVRIVLAPGVLGGLFAKWADWSTLDVVSVRATGLASVPAGTTIVDLNTYFKDGLTLGALLGTALSERMSIWARFSWDRGVATGWTEHTDSWSLFGGIKYKLSAEVEVSANLGLIWLESGKIGTQDSGGPFDATFPSDIAIVPQLGVTTRF